MPSEYFPLSWESTGDQWWYATPIDYAAANGLTDLVKELLSIDPNLLIKLSSLPRTHRLETVWDDSLEAGAHNEVARARARVARALLADCEPKHALLRAGYGGWLMYTACSAGDMDFVQELLRRDPLLVFGEGEYGVTNILYGAARSRNSEVFREVFECAMNVIKGGGEVKEGFVEEMVYRGVHGASRGGNLEVLKEILVGCSDVLGYRDAQGSTVLHSAASKGQVEVVKDLIATYSDLINSTDNQGNTALHVAAYRGYSSVVKILALKSPSLITSRNNNGDTFLHLAVAGFKSPGFHRIDQQSEVIKQLTNGSIINLENVLNVKNSGGRTALHIAITEDIQYNVVELLMKVPSIDLNIRDNDGFTPLDLFKKCPRTSKSDLVTKELVSDGEVSNCQEKTVIRSFSRHLRVQGIGTSPGTSFRLLDSELYPLEDEDNDSDVSFDQPSSRFSSSSREIASNFDLESVKKFATIQYGSTEVGCRMYAASPLSLESRQIVPKSNKKSTLTKYGPTEVGSGEDKMYVASPLSFENRDIASKSIKKSTSMRLKSLLHFPKGSEKNASFDDDLTPLRHKYMRALNPSHSAKEKFKASLMQGVMQGTPPKSCFSMDVYSPLGSFSRSMAPSPSIDDKPKGVYQCKSFGRSTFLSGPLSGGRSLDGDSKHRRGSSYSKSLMNQYFCFGAQGLAVEDSHIYTRTNSTCRRLVF